MARRWINSLQEGKIHIIYLLLVAVRFFEGRLLFPKNLHRLHIIFMITATLVIGVIWMNLAKHHRQICFHFCTAFSGFSFIRLLSESGEMFEIQKSQLIQPTCRFWKYLKKFRSERKENYKKTLSKVEKLLLERTQKVEWIDSPSFYFHLDASLSPQQSLMAIFIWKISIWW